MEHKGRRSVSPKPKTNTAYQGYSQTPGHMVGSLNTGILSSILRAPHPNLQKGPSRTLEGSTSAAQSHISVSSGRGQSPIRVITTMSNIMEVIPGTAYQISPKASGLSPSRIPTTLPPKKSLSPSRPIYIERQSISPKHPNPHRVSNPIPSPSSSSGGQSSMTNQVRPKELLSHLPYLSQTLQSNISHEGLFQQYKPQKQGEHMSVLSSATEGQMLNFTQRGQDNRSRSPSPSSGQPRPAHQSAGRTTTPPHVSTIRRTPSPAHMPIGTESKGRSEQSRTQAVNLVLASSHGTKLQEQPKWADADFKYGDLLQSINKSQEIQSHLLQRGLSPITPSDSVDTKLWVHNPHVQIATKPAQSQQAPPPYSHAVASSSHGLGHSSVTSISNTSGGGFVSVPVTIPTPSSMSSFAPMGFTPVVLPLQNRKSSSPKSQHAQPQTSPKSSYSTIPSSSNVGIHVISSQQPSVSYVHVPIPKTELIPDHVKVYPGSDLGRYSGLTVGTSITQAGPPNVTITASGNIFLPEKTVQAPKHPRNPFTFPATPPVSLTNEKSLAQIGQSKLLVSEETEHEKQRHASDEMPCLMPVSPVSKSRKQKVKVEEDLDLVEISQPYNMRLQTLANFPNNQTHRPTYRATSVAIHKAKVGCITNSAKSLDILRQNLQKSINKEINSVIQSYMDKFFKLGIENIKLNNGDTAVSEDHVQAVCRQILEEAKKMYISDTGRVSVSPARDLSDNVSETGSSGRRSALGRRRHPSDTDSEHSLKPGYKKKKGRYIVNLTGRSTPSKLALQQSKREGPKFEPDRLTEETLFVMGSRANKAMGFGATRGRLYMKHPDLFKYSGDQDDKTWLYEHQHMPATGGKSYIIVLGDIQELVLTDEYRDAPGINLDPLIGFTVPMWMIEKMRKQMMAMRTDLPKLIKSRSRSATPNSNLQEIDADDRNAPKDLPFSNFSSPKQEPSSLLVPSPAEEDLEFLTSAGDTDDPTSRLSPFNMTGGFDDTASQSDLETLDDETSLEPSFTH